MFSRFKTKRAAYSVYLFSEFAVSLLFSMIFTVDARVSGLDWWA